MLKGMISRLTRGGASGRSRPAAGGGAGRGGGGTDAAIGRGIRGLFRRAR